MTLAELLRRSAEYARRSVEELARALNSPARHGAPSFEPAYAPRGNRHFRPKHPGGHGRRFFHWSSRCEARLRRPHAFMFGHMSRRGGKFFRSNDVCKHRHARCHGSMLFKFLFKAFRTTKHSLVASVKPSLCAARVKTAGMPNMLLRAGVSSIRWSPSHTELWQLRFSSLYGNRFSPKYSPYELMKLNAVGDEGISKSDFTLLRFQDQFRSKRAIGAEIREKLRGLASYQQSLSNFLFPAAPTEARTQSVREAIEASSANEAQTQNDFSYDEFLFPEANVLSAAVDFNVAPRLTLPAVGELNEDMLDSVRGAINSQIANLRAVLADVDRIAELGELPVSIEQNGTVLRVHLPNCDAGRASVLVDEKEVTHGRTVEIVAPRIRVPGTDPLSASSSELETMTDSASDVSDEVWQHVRDDTPGLTSMESSQSHSSPSLLTLN